jgi:hypothetical protein
MDAPNRNERQVKPTKLRSNLFKNRTARHLILVLTIFDCPVSRIASEPYLDAWTFILSRLREIMGIRRRTRVLLDDLLDRPGGPQRFKSVMDPSSGEVLARCTGQDEFCLNRGPRSRNRAITRKRDGDDPGIPPIQAVRVGLRDANGRKICFVSQGREYLRFVELGEGSDCIGVEAVERNEKILENLVQCMDTTDA